MKRLFGFIFSFFIYLACMGQWNNNYVPDTTHFDFKNPKVGHYSRLYMLLSCEERLRPDGAMMLDTFIKTVKANPQLIFQIESHTDCRASAEYNRHLSQRRADTLRAYFISQGIDSSRILAVGKGEDEPFIEKCKCELADTKNICTEAEHQLNRRTLLRVVGIKDSSLIPMKKE